MVGSSRYVAWLGGMGFGAPAGTNCAMMGQAVWIALSPAAFRANWVGLAFGLVSFGWRRRHLYGVSDTDSQFCRADTQLKVGERRQHSSAKFIDFDAPLPVLHGFGVVGDFSDDVSHAPLIAPRLWQMASFEAYVVLRTSQVTWFLSHSAS